MMASGYTAITQGEYVGRFKATHVLPRRVRFKSKALSEPGFDYVYFQALLEALPGVDNVRINVKGQSLVIVFDGRQETWERIKRYITVIPSEVFHFECLDKGEVQWSNIVAKGVVGVLAQKMPRTAKAALSWAVCSETLFEGLETLISRGLKVQVLDALAVGISLIRNNYFTATSISTLLSIGEGFEVQSERRSASLLKSLLRPQAEYLWTLRDGVESQTPIDSIEEGEQVIFGAGEAVAVDGVVLEGEASVNQSSISGESVPVHIAPGDQVISGSVVEEGRLVVRVERAGSESSVARIGRFIDQSLRNQSKKQSKSSELADKLVPVTLGLGGLVWLVTGDFSRLASVLTVDYSCAIKLTSPVAVRSGIYAAGQSGVLIKGASALDSLQDVDTLIFDKTGTLTTGNLTVTDIVSLNGYSEEEVLCMAAGAEEHYDHPVARAVVKEAKVRQLELPQISRVDFIVAHGVSAILGDSNVLVGSYHFIAEDENIACSGVDEVSHTLRSQGKSLLYVARDGVLVGVLAMRDELRPEAAEVLSTFKESGIKKIVVLTGDHRETALALQKQLPQIDDVYFELKPEDKAEVVNELKNSGCFTAFIGDGVNDAPALVNAHVGICMPKGADLAKESAQVLLLKEDLHSLFYAKKTATRTNSLIRQCFFTTVTLNSLTILLALGGLQPVGAALLHNLSTVATIGYAGYAASRSVAVS